MVTTMPFKPKSKDEIKSQKDKNAKATAKAPAPAKGKTKPAKDEAETPADLRFKQLDAKGNVTSTQSALRLKLNETLEDGIARLTEEGWNVKDQAYVRQGNMLKSVGQRVMGASRQLEVGKQVEIRYYDVHELNTPEDYNSQTYEDKVEYVGTRGNALIGKTEKGTYKAYPIGVIANTMPLSQSKATDTDTQPNEDDSEAEEET